VAHVELNGSASVGPHGAVAAYSVLSSTWVVDEEVFVEAASGGIEELEVGGDEGEEEGEEGCGVHCCCCLGWWCGVVVWLLWMEVEEEQDVP